jgi:hypothetical protein
MTPNGSAEGRRPDPDRRFWEQFGTLAYMRRLAVLGVIVFGLVLAACGGSSSSGKPAASGSNGPTTTVHIAKVAADKPSVSAKMICESEAENEIYQQATGVKTTNSPKGVWDEKTHVYSCDYVYPHGAVMKLTVKEMSSPDETTAYYNQLAQQLGKVKDQYSIGQGAFTTKNGSLVVRKDYKVLLVDVSKLPASFGVPPDTREHVAQNVGGSIMSCWTGA